MALPLPQLHPLGYLDTVPLESRCFRRHKGHFLGRNSAPPRRTRRNVDRTVQGLRLCGDRRALKLVLNFTMDSSHKAFVFLRTTTPDHFENEEWFSGGTCNRTEPFKKGEVDTKDVDTVMRGIEMEEFEQAASLGAENGVTLKLLDTTRMSLLRPDGHPGLYRQFQPFAKDKNAKVQNDCLHWCSPGPIDSWNDIVMEMVVRGPHR
ncbi:Protein trichome birefringence-like 25 [Hibiscus syriacus]|uniref:Protein trichome birefringence-like 25 n=1 Tax=Hibiscus syriacus TaxID=106335 RepID=A0A6A3BZJ6_HIBSY|nr:Protein trichome birefringence-like 25 [Hibiscus syriacus]